MPTYVVSGEVHALTASPRPATQQSDSAMDLDLEFGEDREEMDVVHQSKVLLVDAGALDGTFHHRPQQGGPHAFRLCVQRPSHSFLASIRCIYTAYLRRGSGCVHVLLDTSWPCDTRGAGCGARLYSKFQSSQSGCSRRTGIFFRCGQDYGISCQGRVVRAGVVFSSSLMSL